MAPANHADGEFYPDFQGDGVADCAAPRGHGVTGERRHGDRRKAPAFLWYPGDFRRDTALQSCSLGARGLWIEMLNLMWDGTPRGYLHVGGRQIDVSRLAHMVGAPFDEVVLLLRELEAAKVFSRKRDGTMFSRRMVRDEARRISRAEGGSKSLGNPKVARPRISSGVSLEPSLPASLGASSDPSPAVAVAVAVKPNTANRDPDGDDWVPQFASAWRARFGGNTPWGRIGKALKDLRASYPDAEILARWVRYLAQPEGKYLTPENFAQKFGEWAPRKDNYLRPQDVA